MTVTFKAIKYRHLLDAVSLGADITGTLPKPGTPEGEAVIKFTVSFVKEWDYIDEDTGLVVPLESYQELTVGQFMELMTEFQAQMKAVSGVKKASPVKSSYGGSELKPAKQANNSHAIPPTG